jgi:ribosomal protein S18 acetylase RimI-like enzyme
MDIFTYKIKTARLLEVYLHLQKCANHFIPCLKTRVDIKSYSEKIYLNSLTFECWSNITLAGLLSVYFNKQTTAFITNISVLPAYYKKSIASNLLKRLIDYAIKHKIKKIDLEVNNKNYKAINLYKKLGFLSNTEHKTNNNTQNLTTASSNNYQMTKTIDWRYNNE